MLLSMGGPGAQPLPACAFLATSAGSRKAGRLRVDGQSERIVGVPVLVGPARHPLPLAALEEQEVSEPRRKPPLGAAFFLLC